MAPVTGAAEPRGIRPSTVAAVVVAILIQLALVFTAPSNVGIAVLLAGVGMAIVLVGLTSPVLAVLLFLLAAFLRFALPVPFLPVDPFLLAFAGVFASAAIGIARRVNRLPQLGAVEAAMVLYLLWNFGSAIVPHTYPAGVPIVGEELAVWRFILTGTMIPFVLYGVGRFVFDREPAQRRLLWFVLGLAAYSALVSVMQFHGPTALIWPRFIVENPGWDIRAVGVLDQPVVNGLILIVGFVVALHLAHQSPAHLSRRAGAYAVAAVATYAIYLTHTRAIWLAFAVVLIAGAVLARGWRPGFLTGLGAVVLGIGANWSDLVSADREAGGVASAGEVKDRLNSLATSLWAVQERPLAGWGIGRFAPVNTYHHQQWSADVEWSRGYGIASHFNELGIAVELGLVGLGLWLAVLTLVVRRLVMAVKLLPDASAAGGLALVALFSFIVLLVTGATVDLRFLVFPAALVMLLVGSAVGSADRADADAGTTLPASVPEGSSR
jgi:O-antigen ligase